MQVEVSVSAPCGFPDAPDSKFTQHAGSPAGAQQPEAKSTFPLAIWDDNEAVFVLLDPATGTRLPAAPTANNAPTAS